MLDRLELLFHTARHLRPIQVWGRLRFRLLRPRPDLRPAPARRAMRAEFVRPARRAPSLLGPRTLRLLNASREIDRPGAWNDADCPKLWLYNLHYFDDLNAASSRSRTAWQRGLIARWVAENPPGTGNGWEPYPTSLRIVNWIRWALRGAPLEPDWLDSLAVQTRWLARRLEHHLLANHLFVNAKALVFAGRFFDGPEAARWAARGEALLARELAEQRLSDGGHFERSPMYHALHVEDLLDLINLRRAAGMEPSPALASAAEAGLSWLAALTHPDGEIALFNDAAHGVAPAPAELARYAGELGLAVPSVPAFGLTRLAASGFARLANDGAALFVDIGDVGPSYQPAHAHAGTLSLELSIAGCRVVVNSGTSVYAAGAERARQRGTPAHSTLTLDGCDSSEVWAAFRVGRRARVVEATARALDGGGEIAATHTGYARLPGRPLHRRTWRLIGAKLTVTDEVVGAGEHDVELVFHLHPDWAAERTDEREVVLRSAGQGTVRFRLDPGLLWSVEPSSYHPQFGLALDNLKLVGRAAVGLPWRVETALEW